MNDKNPNRDGEVDHATRVALFRYKLVEAVLAVDEAERAQMVRELCRKKWQGPGGPRQWSSKTLRRWIVGYQRDGLEGLKPKIRNDRGKTSIPKQWVDLALSLRCDIPSRSAATLIEILKRQPDCPPIDLQALNRALKARGWSRAQATKKPGSRRRRWQAAKVFDLVQGDVSEGIYLPDPLAPNKPIKTKLILWIDDVSRLVPYAQFFFDEKLPRMEHTLKMAILRRGLMNRVYTDNGHIYRANQFKAALAELGVKKLHSKAYTPQGRGKIERMFGVIKEQLYPELIKENLNSLELLNESLWAWLERVYHQRVHSETGSTPLDLYRSQIEQISKADPVRLQRAFLWRFTRKVSSSGFLSLFGNQYGVDSQWTGKKLELRLDPYDLSEVLVFEKQVPIGKAVIKNQKKQRLIEIERTSPPQPIVESGISFLSLLRQEYRQQRQREIASISFRHVEAESEKV